MINHIVMENMDWYSELNRPLLTPPSGVFAPVWSVLYFLIFASFWIYLTAKSDHSRIVGVMFFLAQLFLNISWTPVFFGNKNLLGGLFICLLLWITIICMIISFYKVSHLSAYLLVPYLVWTTFAIYLNVGFLVLNR